MTNSSLKHDRDNQKSTDNECVLKLYAAVDHIMKGRLTNICKQMQYMYSTNGFRIETIIKPYMVTW